MRAVITGTRHGRPDVRHWMERFVRQYGVPELFILGCAPGVDTVARFMCEKHRWSHVVVYADLTKASPERYRERNARMVALAAPGDWCLAFPDAQSRGTWHCLGLAKEAGLRAVPLPLNQGDTLKQRALAQFGPPYDADKR